ncbi:hypothetical protein AVEN_202742-1 [Araneus ventricosus]|uniref:Uncharacterized protein n=1 Tax=Araneus ventricosus TaxID=182803 RepID=A0A4Y2VE70_ARAVE|nr:hypothetical protein AVEN_202742-1 [Araneus ventricosus]
MISLLIPRKMSSSFGCRSLSAEEPNTTILSQAYGANKMSGINLEEYLIADDDLMAFSRVIEEDILTEIAAETENVVEEVDDDTDP